ncbi:MAG TPA: hypothetical protein VJ728_06115, partial [Candidatus Binataceae bacterium]|nr:hypothetical protein [Candidatus Binataceae bacterium]
MESPICRTVKTSIFALFVLSLIPLIAMADSSLVTFRGGIAVDPENGHNGVCGVNPGHAPWTIRELKAGVSTDGHIRVKGSGLLLAGTNGLGSNASQVVRAQLFCDTTPDSCGSASSTSSPGVALEADGDFQINDTLSPPPPPTCTNPVLLITQDTGLWIAAGIPE